MNEKVYNWQLRREMSYKYPEVRPGRQVAWIFDTNKCIACQTCTIACKNAWTSGRGQEHIWWNNVETKPWGYYPLGWDVRLLEKLDAQNWKGDRYEGKTIYESPAFGEEVTGFMPQIEDYQYPNLGEDEVSTYIKDDDYFTGRHLAWMFYLPRICNHCTYPACITGCTTKAVYKRGEDGIVLLDQNRCRGYQECVRACPYKKTFFRSFTQKSDKCISCYPAVEQGDQTQCVQNCIGKIRLFGYKSNYDKPDAMNPIDYLVHIRKIALPLYPQFGTEPNVYYIPPIHVPGEFNRQLFGPGAEKAVELYRKASEDIKLAGLLMLFGSTGQIIHRFSVTGDLKSGNCSGFDESGKEIVKVPVKEPNVLRDKYDEKLKVQRFSVC